MSDSVALSALYGGSGDTTSLLLSALYGGSASSGAGNPNALSALTVAERTQTQQVAAEAKQPVVARAISAFTAAVAAARDPASALSNPAVLTVLLTANGLGDQAAYPALAKKALLSDTTDPKSLANQLTDTRWKSVAATYDFAHKGLSVLQSPQTLSTLGSAYAEVLWRQSLDATTPGLSNALTFRAEAKSITSTLQILGDPIMRSVVTTALGIPAQIAYQDIPAQQKAIADRLDLKRFQDPHFVDSFTQQYLLATQSSADASTGTSASLDQLAIQGAGILA